MESLDLSLNTARQRRNLNAVACLIIFIELADVTFGNSITLLGAVLNIGNPEVIRYLLNISLAYYLWRYYQYFSSDRAFYAITSQFKNNLKHASSIQIARIICKDLGVNGLNGEYLYENLKKNGLFKYTIEAVISTAYDPAKDSNSETKVDVDLSLFHIQLSRISAVTAFLFRGRILTDFLVPYLLAVLALVLETT